MAFAAVRIPIVPGFPQIESEDVTSGGKVRGQNSMETIEVVLANYRLLFKRLYWKDEFALQVGKRDGRRVVLAAALQAVSGLPIDSFDEAYRVFEALSEPVLHRVFLIYKGKQPDTRHFTTHNLYRAPEPAAYGTLIAETENLAEKKTDTLFKRMEQQFGAEELAEAAEVDRQVVASSGLKGAIRKFADEEDEAPMGGFKAGSK